MIAVSNPRFRALLDPLLQVGLLSPTAFVVVAGSLSSKHAAGPPDAHQPRRPNLIHQLPPPSRPQSVGCAAPRVVTRHASHHRLVQAQIRDKPFELGVLLFQLAKPVGFAALRVISDGINPAYFLRQV